MITGLNIIDGAIARLKARTRYFQWKWRRDIIAFSGEWKLK